MNDPLAILTINIKCNNQKLVAFYEKFKFLNDTKLAEYKSCELINLKFLGLHVRPTSIKIVNLVRLLITKTASKAYFK
jgi:hypothetical protein